MDAENGPWITCSSTRTGYPRWSKAQRIRLVFIADEIPAELRRIVEFLNEQMDPAEVLALEVKRYVGDGMKMLVPRLYGHTAAAETKKTAGGRRRGVPQTFDVTLGTTILRNVPREEVLLRIARYLCDAGVRPEEIAAQVPWRSIYADVDGEVTGQQFVARCHESAGSRFDSTKFFCAGEQLE